MRILLAGVRGQVGQELKQALAPLGQVVGLGHQDLDLAQPERVGQVIDQVQPDLIVNAAAYTAVDRAETEFEQAKLINGVAPTLMAESAQRIGATLVHISTDYVFDGTKGAPYSEADTPSPINAYGQSKLIGEDGVRQAGDRHIIFRTAWVYGTHGQSNFVKTMLRLGAERSEIRVVADQIGAPTSAKDIAQAIAQLLAQLNSGQTQAALIPKGTYHFTNSGVASWYDFAVAIFEEAKRIGYKLDVQRVVPITTPDYPTPARRPLYSVLACAKISAVLGTHPPYWRQGLRHMLEELCTHTYESNHSQRR